MIDDDYRHRYNFHHCDRPYHRKLTLHEINENFKNVR